MMKQVRRNPSRWIKKEEHKIDFRVPGLSHSVVEEAEDLRFQELVKRIETHPHRAALHADLQQNSVHNPFSKTSKAMIRELGNVDLIEMCETTPKVQSLSSLLESRDCVLHLRTMLDPRGVVRIRMELEVSSQNFFARISFLLQLVSFTADSDPL